MYSLEHYGYSLVCSWITINAVIVLHVDLKCKVLKC